MPSVPLTKASPIGSDTTMLTVPSFGSSFLIPHSSYIQHYLALVEYLFVGSHEVFVLGEFVL